MLCVADEVFNRSDNLRGVFEAATQAAAVCKATQQHRQKTFSVSFSGLKIS